MSMMIRALTAGCCISLAGCLTTMPWSPNGNVVSEWSAEKVSRESPPVTDSNKISQSPADNNSAEALRNDSEPPSLLNPFERARAKQKQTAEPELVHPAEFRGGHTPTVLPTPAQNPIAVEDPKPVVPPHLIPSTGGQPLPTQGAPKFIGPVVPMGPLGSSRMNPTVRGGILNLGPNDSPIERAIELSQQVSLLEGENKLLSMRVRQLEIDIETREKALDAANNEVSAATQDVIKARLEIETLRKDLAAARERLRQAARDDLETLQTILTVLRRLNLTVAPMKPTVGE